MKLLIIFVSLILAISLFSADWIIPDHPEGKYKISRSRTAYLDDVYNYDVTHYNLYWDVTDTANSSITGRVIILAQAKTDLSEFIFDLYDNMQIDSLIHTTADNLTYDINSSQVTRRNNRTKITLPQTVATGQNLKMQINYHGKPVAGSLMGLNFSTHGNNQAVVASLSEPQDSRIWWPCKDIPSDKATADIYIVTHSHQLAASNGLLQGITTRPDGKLVHHWSTNYPTSTYLLSLAVSNYKKQTIFYHGIDSTKNIPIEIYAYPEIENQTMEDCSPLPQMLKCFGEKFGEYPFTTEKYGIALFGWSGAMEHQTCTTYGSNLIDGQHTYDGIMAHELAHQWLGDLVTCATWKDLWLQEGGASYLENIWQEYKYGQAAYLVGLNKQKLSYLAEDNQARFPIYDPPLAYHFGKTTYNKGSWIYHILRYVVGDTAFFNGLRSYFSDPRWSYSNANTEEFINYMQTYSGVNLTDFKNEWIYSAGFPQYAWASRTSKDQLEVQLLQEQRESDRTPLFTTPIPLKISFSNGQDTVITLKPATRFEMFKLEFDKNISVAKPVFNWQEKILCSQRSMPLDSVLYPATGKQVEIIKTFPNPCKGEFTIRFNLSRNRIHDKIVCQIYNVLGQKISAKTIDNINLGYNDAKLDLRKEAKGLYFVKLSYITAPDYFDLTKILLIR